jgi:hypothetical protein
MCKKLDKYPLYGFKKSETLRTLGTPHYEFACLQKLEMLILNE